MAKFRAVIFGKSGLALDDSVDFLGVHKGLLKYGKYCAGPLIVTQMSTAELFRVAGSDGTSNCISTFFICVGTPWQDIESQSKSSLI